MTDDEKIEDVKRALEETLVGVFLHAVDEIKLDCEIMRDELLELLKKHNVEHPLSKAPLEERPYLVEWLGSAINNSLRQRGDGYLTCRKKESLIGFELDAYMRMERLSVIDECGSYLTDWVNDYRKSGSEPSEREIRQAVKNWLECYM